jgi:hypothetical protein
MIVDGTITGTDIADGSVATAELANGAVTNVKLAADTARLNMLANGGMEIWQRGNGPFASNNTLTADRWTVQIGATASVTRETTTTDGGGVSAKIVTSGAGTTYLGQKLEGFAELGSRTLTMSARVHASVASAVRLNLQTNGANNNYSSYHPGGSTWQTLTVTATVPASPTRIDAYIQFDLAVTAYIDNIMLVVGAVAADYVPLHQGDDWGRCLRYYEQIGWPGANDFTVSGHCSGAGQAWYQYAPFKEMKMTTPTVTKIGTWTVNNCGQPAPSSATPVGFQWNMTSVATGAFFVQNITANSQFVAEANPCAFDRSTSPPLMGCGNTFTMTRAGGARRARPATVTYGENLTARRTNDCWCRARSPTAVRYRPGGRWRCRRADGPSMHVEGDGAARGRCRRGHPCPPKTRSPGQGACGRDRPSNAGCSTTAIAALSGRAND